MIRSDQLYQLGIGGPQRNFIHTWPPTKQVAPGGLLDNLDSHKPSREGNVTEAAGPGAATTRELVTAS